MYIWVCVSSELSLIVYSLFDDQKRRAAVAGNALAGLDEHVPAPALLHGRRARPARVARDDERGGGEHDGLAGLSIHGVGEYW